MCAATETIRFRLVWWARWLWRLAWFSVPVVRCLPLPLRRQIASAVAWAVGKGLRIIR